MTRIEHFRTKYEYLPREKMALIRKLERSVEVLAGWDWRHIRGLWYTFSATENSDWLAGAPETIGKFSYWLDKEINS